MYDFIDLLGALNKLTANWCIIRPLKTLKIMLNKITFLRVD